MKAACFSKRRTPSRRALSVALGTALGHGAVLAQTPAAPASPQAAPAPAVSATVSGGRIRGTVKAGTVPLPGVAVVATNTLTGKKYQAATDITGTFSMLIPRNGRYVVRTELTGFATATQELLINAASENGGTPDATALFTLQLASRVAAEEAAGSTAASALTRGLGRGGLQSLSLLAGAGDTTSASEGGGNAGAQLPSLGGAEAAASSESVAVSGQSGQTNGLANLNEDEIRQRIGDAIAEARQRGGAQGDIADAVVGMLGGMMGSGGGGGRGGGGGGRRGVGGFGAFRNMNPTQPHGAIFYQGGNGALDATTYSLTGAPVTQPAYSNNRFGISFTGSPFIPKLLKASTKQFVFLNVTGQRNVTPENLYAVVPTLAERQGDFSSLVQTVNGAPSQTPIYDPATQQPFAGNVIPAGRISSQALAVLNYYPAPNLATGTQRYNYQTITTAGNNSAQAALRYVRNFGQTSGGPFGAFGGGGGGGGRRQAANGPKTLRQNINVNGSYSHAANDLRNVFLPLGGANETDGYGVTAGYTVGYGRLNNNASANWNRSHATTRNYFTNTATDPAAMAGIALPSTGSVGAFYNGLPNISISNFTSASNTTPQDSINQTISFSDFVSWSHAKHNLRFGTDVRRVHADSLGGSNPLGTFVFSSYSTLSPADRAQVDAGSTQQTNSGAGFADFLLGLPQQSKIQAGLSKVYLRANVFDAFAQDDFRPMSNLTLNFGLRYEYFSPYVEKHNHLVNLDHNAEFTAVEAVLPDASGQFLGSYPRSLVNPDRTLFSPRLGVAWRPKWTKNTVVRGGYGINFNTGQFARFAQELAYQPPFAVTQTNTLSTPSNNTGCDVTTPGTSSNLTLADGFSCATKAIQNNFAVNRDYRLGHVQAYNLDIQKSLPLNIVLNVGYNGSKGGDLDILRAPNHTVSTVTTTDAQAFEYEDSLAESRFNAFVVNARKRLQKGIALQATYTYGHSIDNASSINGSGGSVAQNDQRLDLEEGNSAFDVRHRLTGNWVIELPFGPNRAFFNKGGLLSKVLDGFSYSGDYTFATGNYYTPQYSSSATQIAGGGLYTPRPDRNFSVPIGGNGTIFDWFNKAAFRAPDGFGTASRNSIRGPGVVGVDTSLSRTTQLGETRSFEARVTASNVFNTVQYSAIDTTLNSATFGQVTATANQRRLTFVARYRF